MKKIIISLLALLSVIHTFAQDSFISVPQNNIKKISLSFVPQYILFHGIRIDYEYQNNKKAYVFAPQLYFLSRPTHPINYTDADLFKMYGAGLQVQRKFIRKTDYNNTGYIAAGIGYNFFYTQFRKFLPEPQSIYDNTVYIYSLQNLTGFIHRFDVIGIVGIQNNLPVGLMVEGYVGIGYRYSMPFYSKDIKNPFDRALDIAYTGPIFVVGVKLGFSKFFTANNVQTF